MTSTRASVWRWNAVERGLFLIILSNYSSASEIPPSLLHKVLKVISISRFMTLQFPRVKAQGRFSKYRPGLKLPLACNSSCTVLPTMLIHSPVLWPCRIGDWRLGRAATSPYHFPYAPVGVQPGKVRLKAAQENAGSFRGGGTHMDCNKRISI